VEKLKVKSHHLQAFKYHCLLLYNLFRFLYNVNNNCLGDLKYFCIFCLAFEALVFVAGKGFQFYVENQENKKFNHGVLSKQEQKKAKGKLQSYL